MERLITIVLALILMYPGTSYSQQATKVVYGQTTTLNNLTVSGIEISSKKAKTATISDSLGYFVIVCNSKDRLKFKSKVFNTTSVKINGKTPDTLNVQMNFVNSDKNVEIAIGYGYIKEQDRTQAVQYTKNRIDYCSYKDIFEILRNTFPNLQVSNDGCVIVRGPSSLYGPNCALYVVNGIKTEKIDYIPPCDVKDISVIKDGSAAIYGCQGATGVVLINLKDGHD